MSDKLESFLFKSISYNMLLQLSFRVFSFILNAVLYRNVHTDLIGACNFRLALLYTTIMFLSREPFRRALPNFKSVEKTLESFINSLWLVVPSGLLISIIFGFLWNMFEKPSDLTVKNYDVSILICCVACLVELCGEPAYSVAQMLYLAKLKVIIEASCLFLFNLIFMLLALYFPDLGALSYSIARLVFSVLFVISNFYLLIKKQPDGLNLSLKSLLPNSILNQDVGFLSFVKAYFAQSIFKQILTEGERYLITMFNLLSYSESGIYDIVSNLGSLIARFIFAPIEDASYIYFTNSLKRGIRYKDQSNLNSKTKSYFEFLLKILSLIGLVVLIFGQSYSKLLLQIYGGSTLGENETCVNLLRLNCAYIYLLALNGITECFFNSTMSEDQIRKHNYRLVLFSILFMVLASFFAKIFQIYGFLMANCMNMLIRIGFSSFYIKDFFTGFKFKHEGFIGNSQEYDLLQGYFPNRVLGSVLVMSLALTKASEVYLYVYPIVHLVIGGLLFLVTLFSIFMQESQIKDFVLDTFRKFKRS